MRLAGLELGRIVHQQALHGVERARSAKLNIAHVRDIKQAYARADGHMLRDEAGVFDRHIPAAEVDHLGFVLAVPCVQSSRAKLRSKLGHAAPEKCCGLTRP